MVPVLCTAAQWKEVRNKIDLVQVARELLGEPQEKSGDTFFWSCPFHGGTEPSFQITAGKSRWKCSGCVRWGDAVDLVRNVNQVSFSKALEFLSRPEFYPSEEPTGEIAADESSDEITSDASTGGNDNWIDDLLRDSPECC
jgi:DNA primase